MKPVSPAKLSRLAGASIAGGACALALARALAATPPPSPASADAAARRTAFFAVASDETKMRRDAAKKFPTDPWSQDDDFHQSELKRAKAVASEHGIRLGDVLSAIDEGIREGWPHSPGVVIRATVPPCQPRAIY
jgi:hypothetical protein